MNAIATQFVTPTVNSICGSELTWYVKTDYFASGSFITSTERRRGEEEWRVGEGETERDRERDRQRQRQTGRGRDAERGRDEPSTTQTLTIGRLEVVAHGIVSGEEASISPRSLCPANIRQGVKVALCVYIQSMLTQLPVQVHGYRQAFALPCKQRAGR